MNYKKLTIEEIIDWCKANDQVAWLKEAAAKKTACKVYPRIKVDGKYVVDKTAKPSVEMRPRSFIELKREFCEKFMPDLLPKAAKKESFHDLIARL